MNHGIQMNAFNFFAFSICRTAIFHIMLKHKEKVFYAVGVGHKTGVYQTWSDCKKQVDGVPNPKFRKFNNLQEAEQFVGQWSNKSQSVNVSSQSPQKSANEFNSRSDEGSPQKHQSKGDKQNNKKNNKNKNQTSINKFSEEVNNQQTKKTAEKSKLSAKKKERRDKFFLHVRNKIIEKKCSKGRMKKVSPHQSTSHSAKSENGIKERVNLPPLWETIRSNWQKMNEHRQHFRPVWTSNHIVNPSESNTSNSLPSSMWNVNVSVNGPQAAVSGYQNEQANTLSYSSYHQYPITDQFNYPASYVQGPYTSPCERYAETVNRNILNIAAAEFPSEGCIPSVKTSPGYSQGLTNNVSDYNSNKRSAHDSDKDAVSPCTTFTHKETSKSGSYTVNNEVQNKTDERNQKSQESESVELIEVKDINQSFTDDTINDSNAVHQDLMETLKENLISLKPKSNNENSLTAVTNVIDKFVDVVRVVLKEVVSGNAGVDDRVAEQLKSNNVSKTKVPESEECRQANSFSGIEAIVANDASTFNAAEDDSEDDATDNTLRGRIVNCERKVDICIGRVSDFLSGLTDIKNELKLLKRQVRQRCSTSTGKDLNSKLSTSSLSRGFASNCNSGEGDGASRIGQESDYQRSQGIKSERDGFDDVEECLPTPAKRKRTLDEGSSSSSHELRLDREIKQESADLVAFITDEEDYVVVYTDGSCMFNGTDSARAGIGIWFDDGHPLNVSRPLSGAEPTNNNAEIQAARIACELALSAGITKLKICTDSEFLINCITKWVHRWKNNGWTTGANKPVKNRAELEKLIEVTSRLSVRWEKVAGHSQIKGNEMADQYANDGAKCYKKK